MTARMITSEGFAYRLTDDDLDWLSRSIANEGGDDAATCWTYAQRFVLMHGHFSSFAAMVRAHSQPVNPRWLADGDFCRPGGQYAGTEGCEPAKTAHRAQVQAPGMRYPTALAYVHAWASGLVANPCPRAVDFRAADDVAQRLVDSGRMRLVLASGNWYFATPETYDWDADHVLVAGRGVGGSIWRDLGIGLGVAFAIGAVTWVAAEEWG